MLNEFSAHLSAGPGIQFLRSFPPKELHDIIRRLRLRVWDDRLTKALLGVCIEDGDIVAVGYSYPKVVDSIMLSQQSSDNTNARLEAMEFVERNLIPANLGPDTPYFITPVS